MRPRIVVPVTLLAMLAVAAGGAGWWYLLSARAHDAVGAWTLELEQRGHAVTHAGIETSGFPTALRLTIAQIAVTGGAGTETSRVDIPLLETSFPVWSPEDVRFTGPRGISAAFSGDNGTVRLLAASLQGQIRAETGAHGERRWSARGELAELEATAEGSVAPLLTVERAEVDLDAPEALILSPDEVGAIRVDSRLSTIALGTETPLGRTIEQAFISSDVTAPLPSSWSGPELSAWRDRGGRLTLHHGTIDWGPLSLHGAGEISLDEDLRPQGVVEVRAHGYEDALDAFAREGLLPERQVPAMKLALSFMSRQPTPDGPRETGARLEMADGWVKLGPFRIAPIPRVVPR